MSTQVSGGLGTVLNHLISTTPTPIAQVTSITPPGLEMGSVDTFNLASTVKTNRPTLAAMTDCTFHLQWDPGDATHALLVTKLLAKTVEGWNIVFADEAPTTYPFTGWVKSFIPAELDPETNIEADVTISVQSVSAPL